MNDANVKLIQKGFDAFAAADMETMTDVLATDIVWHSPGNNILSGDYNGIEEVLGLFARVGQETGGQLTNDVHAILADDDHGVALVNSTATRNGKTVSSHQVFVYHLAGGKASEVWLLTDNQAATDDLWS
jgi:ketosteroid isomerase-like protein